MNKIRKGSQTARTNVRRLHEAEPYENYTNPTLQNTIQQCENLQHDAPIPIKFTHRILHANKNVVNSGKKLYNCYSEHYYDRINNDQSKTIEPISLFSIAEFNRKKCLSQSLRKRKYKNDQKQAIIQQKNHFETPFISRQCKTAKNRKLRQRIKLNNTIERGIGNQNICQVISSDYIKIAYEKQLQKILKKNFENISERSCEKQIVQPPKKHSQICSKQKMISLNSGKDSTELKGVKRRQNNRQKDYLRPWSGFNCLNINQTQML